MFGSAGFGCACGGEGRDHQTAGCVFEEVDSEGGRVDRNAFDRRDAEGHRKELHARFCDRLGGVVVEGVARDAELEVVVRSGVDLCDEEGLCEVAKSRRV